LDPNTLSQKLSLDQGIILQSFQWHLYYFSLHSTPVVSCWNIVDFDGKRVLVRVDYNVPIKHGVVTDTARIDTTLETLRYLLDRKGPMGGVKCIVLIAHLGQPTGNYNREDFTLFPAVAVLKKLLGRDVVFLPDCVGPAIEQAVSHHPLPFCIHFF
jgi:3-phosphoglycerate kinase